VARRGNDAYSVSIDPQVWYKLKKDLDAFDKTLSVELRRRIKNAGQVAADAVKKQLQSGGGRAGTPQYKADTAAALAAATKVSVSFSARSAGARIITAPGRIPLVDRGLLVAYNGFTFRHPVYGRRANREDWAEQKSTAYFDPPIREALNRVLVGEINAAIDEATAQIKNRMK